MTWADLLRESEELAASAHVAKRNGDGEKSKDNFYKAALLEQKAVALVGGDKPRTLGILSVSAAALYYKADKIYDAELAAHTSLSRQGLPEFAKQQLKEMLQTIWNRKAQQATDVQFEDGQVIVSVKGGEVVSGGAPLDLILSKVQTIQSMFLRTAEMLKHVPFRKRGPPTKPIQEGFKPWLFQAVPGSYQFVVAVQKPIQDDLYPETLVGPKALTEKFLEILQASTDESLVTLEKAVPDSEYRNTFLKLTRNLAPNGKRFETLQIRNAMENGEVTLSVQSRKLINVHLTPVAELTRSVIAPTETISGVLRALDLEHDWLEVVDDSGSPIRVNGVGDIVDDTIGPMVNHRVSVKVSNVGIGKFKFLDIEQE